jgi:hypothetical protein
MKPFTITKKNSTNYSLGNVNLPSGYVDDLTLLGNAIIPKNVKKVQYVITTKKGWKYRVGRHGQLRFIFSKPIKTDWGEYPDLIISWEAWRKTGKKIVWNDSLENEFLLTSRAYVGVSRWLKDYIRGFDIWKVYDLKIKDKDFNLVNNSCATNSFDAISQFLNNEQGKKLLTAKKHLPKWVLDSKHVKTPADLARLLYYLARVNKLLPARTYKYLKRAGLVETKYGITVSKSYKYPDNPYNKIKKVIM